jgi:GNAT superfamily N-acetyltransferase
MMRQSITVETDLTTTPRILQAGAMFDVPPSQHTSRTWQANLPIEERPWSVGLIVGPSGAGKSSVAGRCFGTAPAYEWHSDRSVLDDFPPDLGIRDVVDLLTSVGFGSPPAWMRPHWTLSTGEQFRVECARRLAETPPGEIVLIDEFTSVVDRQVAQVASHTLAKTVRRTQRQLVAVTCHYDVVEWLQPDWIYQPHAEDFAWRSVQPRPGVELGIYPINRAAWRVFAAHHYMSPEHHRTAKCFGAFVGDQCVAFLSYRHFVHPKIRDIKIGHRLVVLPDWQGLGIAQHFLDVIAQHCYDQGYRFRSVVAHPAMIRSLSKSLRWHQVERKVALNFHNKSHLGPLQARTRRLNTYSFEYVPPAPVQLAAPVSEVIGAHLAD